MFEAYLKSLKQTNDDEHVKFYEICSILKDKYDELKETENRFTFEMNFDLKEKNGPIKKIDIIGYDYIKDILKIKMVDAKIFKKRNYIEVKEVDKRLEADLPYTSVKSFLKDFNYSISSIRYLYKELYNDFYTDKKDLDSSNSRYKGIVYGYKMEVYCEQNDEKVWSMLYDVKENRFKYRARSTAIDETLIMTSVEFPKNALPKWMQEELAKEKDIPKVKQLIK